MGVIDLNFDIRKAIIDNIASNNRQQLEAVITDAIKGGEEKMLPGLGVLFELIWEQSSQMDKTEMIEALELGIKHSASHHWS